MTRTRQELGKNQHVELERVLECRVVEPVDLVGYASRLTTSSTGFLSRSPTATGFES